MLVAAVWLPAAQAVEPDEILQNPELESRARAISQNLRCLVCRNETIDESNAPLASDLRVLVREQLVNGMSDEEVYDFVTERYGEFVLLKPELSGGNYIVYFAGPVLFCFALACAAAYVRRGWKSRGRDQHPLTDDEERRLDELIRRD